MTDRLKILSWFTVTTAMVLFAFAMGRTTGYNDAMGRAIEELNRSDASERKSDEISRLYGRIEEQAEELKRLRAAAGPTH